MSLSPRFRHRKDANHNMIIAALERCGWYCQDTSQTSLGYDAVIHKAGRSKFLEIKDGSKKPSEQKLTPHEKAVHARLEAHGVIVELITSVEDLAVLERPQRARQAG